MVEIDTIIKALCEVYDPEIPVSIYDLGLIYEINIKEDKSVDIVMTLTSPNCPVAQSLPNEIKTKIEKIEKVKRATVKVVFDPPWSPEDMSEAAKLELNL